jgi:UDP-N-acetylglucosamine--N-acetylmuramyl-(pentapeptide) pyrophosphoryl-undecaprenol N-acetylglucosamine transferase
MKKKILVCAGGTGGHIYPALAVIEFIKDNHYSVDILFIGGERGLDRTLLEKVNLNYRIIKSCGLVLNVNLFKKVLNIIKFAFFFFYGFFQSLKIVLEFKPDIIIGMGGYICAPVLSAGIFTGVKITLHEQNYIPGRLNRVFSKFARYIFISFSDTAKYFKMDKKRIIFTGNPLRKMIKKSGNTGFEFEKWGLKKKRFTIVAFGGSLGAEKINNAVINLYNYFKDNDKIQILLISGKRFYRQLVESKNNIIRSEGKLIFKIFEYINEMNEVYSMSDLIISRAGANTVSEIIEYNIPSILIPYPRAVDNHQFYNADFLVSRGKAVMIEDKFLSERKLVEVIKELAGNNWHKYKEMKKLELGDIKKNSAGLIASKLMEV